MSDAELAVKWLASGCPNRWPHPLLEEFSRRFWQRAEEAAALGHFVAIPPLWPNVYSSSKPGKPMRPVRPFAE